MYTKFLYIYIFIYIQFKGLVAPCHSFYFICFFSCDKYSVLTKIQFVYVHYDLFSTLTLKRGNSIRDKNRTRTLPNSKPPHYLWAPPQPSEPRRTLLIYAAHFWSTSHAFELRRTLLSYAAHIYILGVSNTNTSVHPALYRKNVMLYQLFQKFPNLSDAPRIFLAVLSATGLIRENLRRV